MFAFGVGPCDCGCDSASDFRGSVFDLFDPIEFEVLFFASEVPEHLPDIWFPMQVHLEPFVLSPDGFWKLHVAPSFDRGSARRSGVLVPDDTHPARRGQLFPETPRTPLCQLWIILQQGGAFSTPPYVIGGGVTWRDYSVDFINVFTPTRQTGAVGVIA